jgi:hypothetical protein
VNPFNRWDPRNQIVTDTLEKTSERNAPSKMSERYARACPVAIFIGSVHSRCRACRDPLKLAISSGDGRITLILEKAMKHFRDIKQTLRFKAGRNRALAGQSFVPVYRVGELFHHDRQSWPARSRFSYSPGGLELTLFEREIRADMIEDVRRGESEFALLIEPPVIVLAYRFGQAIPWDDAPYTWHLQPADWRVIPPTNHAPETRALLWVSLVGANDGIIHAQRGVALSPSFTLALHIAIRAQALTAFDPHECALAISRKVLNPAATIDRLPQAVARTMGNE